MAFICKPNITCYSTFLPIFNPLYCILSVWLYRCVLKLPAWTDAKLHWSLGMIFLRVEFQMFYKIACYNESNVTLNALMRIFQIVKFKMMHA